MRSSILYTLATARVLTADLSAAGVALERVHLPYVVCCAMCYGIILLPPAPLLQPRAAAAIDRSPQHSAEHHVHSAEKDM